MKKKLNIEKLKVESFVCDVQPEQKNEVKGGESAWCVTFNYYTQCMCNHH
ncbi:pinensin family lanthipeptide [Roseivirga sp. BDSF3-8]